MATSWRSRHGDDTEHAVGPERYVDRGRADALTQRRRTQTAVRRPVERRGEAPQADQLLMLVAFFRFLHFLSQNSV